MTTSTTVTGAKTLRILWCSNNRVADDSILQNAKPKKQASRSMDTRPNDPTIRNGVISTTTPASLEDRSVPSPVPSRRTPDLFRETSFSGCLPGDLEDMLTLKRASRVYDSDDEDESPTKRLKRETDDERDESSEEVRQVSQLLDWCDRLEEDRFEGFRLAIQ